MGGGRKIFQKNKLSLNELPKKINLNKGIVVIYNKSTEFGGTQVKNFLGKIDYIIKRYGKACKAISIRFDIFNPKDKLSYILFEYIIYTLLKEFHQNIYVYAPKVENSIQTEGVQNSLLKEWICRAITKDRFLNQFGNRIKQTNFRRIIEPNDNLAVSTLMTDIKSYLKFFYIDRDDSSKISEIISELADNACEHAKSQCLIDIDVSEKPYYKDDDDSTSYYSVNLCVLNFSDIYLGDTIKEKVENKKYRNSARYEKLKRAFEIHKQFFNEDYNEKKFFMLAAFQNRISGRTNETETGGKGLSQLIRELEDKAESHNCYVMSGKDVIIFRPEFLEFDDDGWIGFNNNNNFLNERPDKKVIKFSDTFLNGTAYNLTLIYRRLDDEKKQDYS